MSHNPATLAALIREHRPSSSRDGYPPWLRIQVGNCVAKQRDAGVSMAKLSKILGVSHTSLLKWARSSHGSTGGGFAPVVISSAPLANTSQQQLAAVPPQESPSSQPREPAPAGVVHLTSPQGFSLHGLTVEQAVAVFTKLR